MTRAFLSVQKCLDLNKICNSLALESISVGIGEAAVSVQVAVGRKVNHVKPFAIDGL